MIPYYCNEAVLQLQNVHGLVDRTRQLLEVVTQDGVELQLVIEREELGPDTSLAAKIEASLAERRRSLRGFEIVSATEREYPEVVGTEARLTYVHKERGPLFVHEFHCLLDRTRLTFIGTSRLAHATACDQWMQTTLHYLKLR